MRTLSKIIIAALVATTALPTFAVTEREMEKARAISAKIYLRWANNGSDYLEKIDPSSLSDLEKQLKEKEKANIKAFKAIPVPSDYASWDKERLVEYWSTKAFAAAGLNADGVRSGAKSQARKALNKMTVTPPASAQPEEPKAAAEEPKAPAAESAQVKEEKPAEDFMPQEVAAEVESVAEKSVAAADSIDQIPDKTPASSSTWIYVVALALLVVAVIALVVYASKNMGGKQEESPRQPEREPEPSREPVRERAPEQFAAPSPAVAPSSAAVEESARLREKFAETLARKQEEIRSLTRQLTELREELDRERLHAESLRLENDRLRSEATGAAENSYRQAAASVAAQTPHQAPARAEAQPKTAREIYLGRVNSRGLFVRADRNFQPGGSVYVLSITDDYSGSFRVVRDPSVYESAFARPEDILGGGCVAMDITDTRGRHSIVTDAPGTAVFEDNCWKVVRKAKIRYE